MANKMTTPKFIGTPIHQGDTQWFQIESLPEGAKKIDNTFIAKSERSGNAHILCGDYETYTVDGVEGFFMKVGAKGAVLNHSSYSYIDPKYMSQSKVLPKRDHNATVFTEGIYFVGIQQRKKQFSKVWEKARD